MVIELSWWMVAVCVVLLISIPFLAFVFANNKPTGGYLDFSGCVKALAVIGVVVALLCVFAAKGCQSIITERAAKEAKP